MFVVFRSVVAVMIRFRVVSRGTGEDAGFEAVLRSVALEGALARIDPGMTRIWEVRA